ncbi:hypothetical protein BJ912DRAFT_1082227 [Pholiota molesta]|nr:hypothetical protein BJ912DRAFT_1082227 [Pholiota molesta]
MGHKRSLDGLLAEKDEKIAILEHHIQGYVGRLSLLQSRLLATLDTLDVIQTHHAQELGNAIRNQTILREKLDEYIKVVRAAELERDDMRDAVLKLVEKVETSNDYRTWPHSQIRLSSLADPVAVTERTPAPTLDNEEVISYASALNEILRRERDDERRAHAQTREIAEARILVLEAKLSRREAELEACVERPQHVKAVWEETTPRAKTRRVDFDNNDGIPSDQIISILDDTVARNKLLEKEISALYRRLENARAAASEHPSDDRPPRLNHSGRSKSRVSSHLDSPASSTTSVRPPMLHDLGNQSTSLNVDHEDHDVLKDLEQQIKLLSDKIDSFADERNVLLQTISLSRPVGSDNLENLETRLRILENECLGLKASQNALRDELEATRAHANAHENELLDAINSLRLTLTSSPLQHRAHEPYQTQTAFDLLEPPDDDGEISMELATPLLPLTAISPDSPTAVAAPGAASPSASDAAWSHAGDEQHSPYVDPPSIPLPGSPEEEYDDRFDDANDADVESEPADSPTLSHIVLPMLGNETSRNLYRATSSFVAELRQVENEIAGARGQLAAGETAFDRVEELVHDLHPP